MQKLPIIRSMVLRSVTPSRAAAGNARRRRGEIGIKQRRDEKAADVGDCRDQPHGDYQVDASDAQQPRDRRIVQAGLRALSLDDGEIFAEAVELAKMASDGGPLVVRHHVAPQPGAPASAKQIRMRASGNQVSEQDRMHLVFDPRAFASSTGSLSSGRRMG